MGIHSVSIWPSDQEKQWLIMAFQFVTEHILDFCHVYAENFGLSQNFSQFTWKETGNLRFASHNLLNSFQIIFLLLKLPHLDPNALPMRPFEEKELIITCAIFSQTVRWDGDVPSSICTTQRTRCFSSSMAKSLSSSGPCLLHPWGAWNKSTTVNR